MEEIKCGVCGKVGFKSEAGLAGHKKIAHGEDRRKTTPDKIGERLEALEAIAAAGINPGKVVDSKEKVIDKLKLLLPAIEKYGLAVCNLEKDESTGWLGNSVAKYRIVNNSDITDAPGHAKIEHEAEVY